mmetsp:Transcript_14887/g.16515  ORF Transcript_14887/g.16515 Transcript_14887/m.16515 type:complete len:213 (-) Transcript_14887:138-776(-)
MLVGTFLAFDRHMNLVLADTEEFRRVKAKKSGEQDREMKRSLGLIILRGDNITSMTAEAPPVNQTKKLSEMQQGAGKAIPSAGRGKAGNVPNFAQAGLTGPAPGTGVGSNYMMPQKSTGIKPDNVPGGGSGNVNPMGGNIRPNMGGMGVPGFGAGSLPMRGMNPMMGMMGPRPGMMGGMMGMPGNFPMGGGPGGPGNTGAGGAPQNKNNQGQ